MYVKSDEKFHLIYTYTYMFKCMTYVWKNYEPIKNEFYMISITKSFTLWDAKFVK
jgi:hypothetical protein